MTRVTRKLGPVGKALAHHFEQGPKGGFASTPYRCSAGYQTIGWGHKLLAGESYPTPITKAMADAIFDRDVAKAERSINRFLDTRGIVDTQQQFDALVCLAFNVGAGTHDGIRNDLADSTLLDKWEAGDVAATAEQFLRWNKERVNGKLRPSAGLTRRRMAERHLFLTGELKTEFRS